MTGTLLERARQQLRTVVQSLHKIIGAPDYETYLQHHRRCHPDSVALSRDQFVSERLLARYSRPGSRCC